MGDCRFAIALTTAEWRLDSRVAIPLARGDCIGDWLSVTVRNSRAARRSACLIKTAPAGARRRLELRAVRIPEANRNTTDLHHPGATSCKQEASTITCRSRILIRFLRGRALTATPEPTARSHAAPHRAP